MTGKGLRLGTACHREQMSAEAADLRLASQCFGDPASASQVYGTALHAGEDFKNWS